MSNRTPEQESIIVHDPDKHATVLAVAGAGKTTTMVHRIGWLLRERGVAPELIRAVMYNTAARADFEAKLSAERIEGVTVQTFHALGWKLLTWAAKKQYAPRRTLLNEERDVNALAKEAIKAARDAREIEPEVKIDVDLALQAISTWKAMLTPPEQAQHLFTPGLERVYAAFERIRTERNLATFDDQVYDAVRLLESSPVALSLVTDRLEHLIIDEFQDVNLARLRLAKLLAGQRARVMVVGDDDQCIYEWQGARSAFIKRGFQTEFTTFPHATYKLTRSFRFGPAIAQIAANVIGHNTDRVEKDLVAADLLLPSTVTLDAEALGGGNPQAMARIEALLAEAQPPSSMAVLVRKYSQSFGVQGGLLERGIPFFVEGQRPWHELFPVRLALAYIDAAAALDAPLTETMVAHLVTLVNRPMRFVKQERFADVVREGVERCLTLRELLEDPKRFVAAGIARGGAEALWQLGDALRDALEPVSGDPEDDLPPRFDAGSVLGRLIESVDFKAAFESYERESAAEDDLQLLRVIAGFLSMAQIEPGRARSYLEGLDPRRGAPEEQCIRITTIFKAKGLEWDHVLIPDLVDGQCPDLRESVNTCVNVRDPTRVAEATATIESERRLFYVAVTRARRTLHLFASPEERRPESRFIHEACVEPTLDAVEALQRLVSEQGQRARLIKRLEMAADKDARLRDGLVKMIRRASESDDSGGALRKALSEALFRINKLPQRPFAYPHAYPEFHHAPPRWVRASDGLPF